MFLSSLIEKLWTKEEKHKAGCTLTFGGLGSKLKFFISKTVHSVSERAKPVAFSETLRLRIFL